ncbi:hypothetical protein J6590_095866 [Homalodisca vitripennis]|nr:hypothetical protein J6590_095866 [Homalodisca vitripennis]
MDAQIGESSACATALLCGVKANFETVGLDARGRFENCKSSVNSKVESLVDWAHREGKATGIVTNTRVSHATPAALFAHSASRYWEDDSKVPPGARKVCKDITRQLVENEPGRSINEGVQGHSLPDNWSRMSRAEVTMYYHSDITSLQYENERKVPRDGRIKWWPSTKMDENEPGRYINSMFKKPCLSALNEKRASIPTLSVALRESIPKINEVAPVLTVAEKV